jgi:hypothetical protein
MLCTRLFVTYLGKEDVDDNDKVMYHAASIQLMEAYLWKGILAQHVLYLLGGLSIVPARFCANSEMCIGTNAHNKVKGLLSLVSLNKCLHDLAKEQKVAPMVVECVNCEYYCHEGDNRNLLTSGLDSGSSWLDGVNGILMQQEPDLPKQDYWNQRAIASLANTLNTVVEPAPMP